MLLYQRNLILSLLLILTLIAWAILVWQKTMMHDQAMSFTMGVGAPLFLTIWIVMMVAMMFPTALPMILTFSKIYEGKKTDKKSFIPTWIFVSGYLVVWTLFGVAAYFFALGAQGLMDTIPWFMGNAPRIGGILLIFTGLYQLTPLKRMCLTKCRSPFQFILSSWKNGYLGSFRMGIEHGVYCLGCCWLLFILLFPLGIMNIGVMALLTLLIFAEKSLFFGQKIAKAAALFFILYGISAFFYPQILPMFM